MIIWQENSGVNMDLVKHNNSKLLRINPSRRNGDLQCHFCGDMRSVKYKTKVFIIDTLNYYEETEKEVCVCNACALKMIRGGIDG